MNTVLLIAHAPLAHALREAALHVFPDAAADMVALDVQAQDAPETSLAAARAALARLPHDAGALILVDICGATPCNVAARLHDGADGARTRLLAGVNLPMLLRALTYRHEPLDSMLQKAQAGGTQGITTPVTCTTPPPQHQPPRATHDQERDHHQQ